MKQNEHVIVDAHVHFHDCFDTGKFLNAACKNFDKQMQHENNSHYKCVLMLSESAWEHWFQDLVKLCAAGPAMITDVWRLSATNEPNSLKVENQSGQILYVVAGRQIVTKERLEVLALGTERTFADGRPMRDVISDVKDCGALAVIPWGFGKWLGARGEFLEQVLNEDMGPGVYLGDNSGRIPLLPYPKHFEQVQTKNIKILPGSDPLPFVSENRRPGSFGFLTQGSLSDENPAASIKELLLDKHSKIKAYGKLETPLKFLRNQIRMQIVSRTRKKT